MSKTNSILAVVVVDDILNVDVVVDEGVVDVDQVDVPNGDEGVAVDYVDGVVEGVADNLVCGRINFE